MNRERVARNFVRRYGRSALRAFVKSCEAGESNQSMADALGVSRERVRQWRDAFGRTVTFYSIHKEVAEILDEDGGA